MPLPTFVIAGERRCGTTSLARWVQSHPDVYLHPRTDLAYFVEDEIVGTRDWLDGEVDSQRWGQTHSVRQYSDLFVEGHGYQAIGEKSADYLFWRPAHTRIAEYLPDARFLIILRNPVDRAWSHYWNEVGKGRETLSFEEALAVEEDRCQSSAYARDHLSYRARGFYDESLSAFFEYIPPNRVHIVTLEQMQTEAREILQAIYEFIDVDPTLGLELAGTRYNANQTTMLRPWAEFPGMKHVERMYTSLVRKIVHKLSSDVGRRRELRQYFEFAFRKPAAQMDMSPDVRCCLQEVYAPHIEALESLLGRDFIEWK